MLGPLETGADLLERTDPGRALAEYARLLRASRSFSPEILVASIVCPALAAEIAWSLRFLFPGHRTIGTAVILAFLGYLPPLLLFERRYLDPYFRDIGWDRPYMREARERSRKTFRVLGVAQVWVKDLFIVFLILVVATIVFAPFAILFVLAFGSPANIPPWLGHSVFALATVFATAFMLSKARMRLRPIRGYLAGLLVDLRLGAATILELVASLAPGALVVGGSFGVAITPKLDLVLGAGATGLLFGLSMACRERDTLLANLCRLGEARCRLRLGGGSWSQRAEVRYRLQEVLETDEVYRRWSITEMAHALLALERGDPGAAQEELAGTFKDVLADTLDSRGPHRALWNASIAATFDQLGQPLPAATSAVDTGPEPEGHEASQPLLCPPLGRGVVVVVFAVLGFAFLRLLGGGLAPLAARFAYTAEQVTEPGGTAATLRIVRGTFALAFGSLGLCYGTYNLTRVVGELVRGPRRMVRFVGSALFLRILGQGLIVHPLAHSILSFFPIFLSAICVHIATLRSPYSLLYALFAMVAGLLASSIAAWYLLWRWACEGSIEGAPPYSWVAYDLWPDRWGPVLLLFTVIGALVTLFLADVAI